MLRFDRKRQNSVRQLSFNEKINLKKKRLFPQICTSICISAFLSLLLLNK